MATVKIEVSDEDGRIDMRLEFDPPLDNDDDELSPAQAVAFLMIQAAKSAEGDGP